MDRRPVSRRGRAPAAPVLTVAVLAVLTLVFTLVAPAANAGFTSTATDDSSFSSRNDFGIGALSSWGGTWSQNTALHIGTRTDWQSVATGYSTDCGIRTDHSLWCSGYNGDGQLGQGDTRSRPDFTQVGTDTTWTSVGVGRSPVCGTKSDGTLWCWGNNAYGATGDGVATSASRLSPRQVTSPSATGWSQLSVGYHNVCAIRTDTTLWCWGGDANGQVGDRTFDTAPRYGPVQVKFPATMGWTQISSGYQHTCARRGTDLYCWGSAQYGQVGSGSSGAGAALNQLEPTQVSGEWATVSSGNLHTCGLKTDATLWCWGLNSSGQLGLGNTTDVATPTQVGTLTWDSVSSGQAGVCATHPGELWCWGDNTFGSVGDGGTGISDNRSTPVQIISPASTGWTPVALATAGSRVCDIRTDGSLWCWGFGYGTANVPGPVDSGTDWRRPAAGFDYSCALKAVSQLYCWGLNGSGQLGIGTTAATSMPTRVVSTPVTDWAQVSAGSVHTCAVGTDTTLWCWGWKDKGRLGVGGSSGSRTVPTQVTSPSSTGWSQVAAGSSSTCAIRTDTTLYCWGYNTNGQLGIGSAVTTVDSPAQVMTPALTGWSGVSLGSGFACALQSADRLYCWGANSNGQLGSGGGSGNQTTPVQVNGTWTSVSTGASHTCAINGSAQLFCWGYALNGRLGNGVVGQSTIPVQVGTATDWRSVSGGSTFTCGSRARPATYCWGAGRYGQVGIGDNYDWLTPQLVEDLRGRPIATGSQSVSVLAIHLV